jgi:hypothetical protein
MLIATNLAIPLGPLKSNFALSFMRNKQVYRFNSQEMDWQLTGPQRAVQIGLGLAYERKSWKLSTQTTYIGWQIADQQVLPPLTSDLRLQWKGGVFKNKQLKLLAAATVQGMYGGSFSRMAYLPFFRNHRLAILSKYYNGFRESNCKCKNRYRLRSQDLQIFYTGK